MDGSTIAPTWQQQQPSNATNLASSLPSTNTTPDSTAPPVPDFVKPFPDKIGPDEAHYLSAKGALSIPDPELKTALLQAYVDFVYPFMPTIDLNEFLGIVQREDGVYGKVSLLVFQAIMFAGSTFVDMAHLRRAGFHRRQEARKFFYQKARLLYDFDYEDDRIYLLQALLIFTYWYESPNDQKDTWHWMGIAISVATSIGLNRDPSKGPLDKSRQRLWKRLWWNCVIRDRLIAIGMRRPLRIKSQEHNVPMLTADDFPLTPIPDDMTCVSTDCVVARNAEMRRKLATLCVAKAEFCECISDVLSAQYSQLGNGMAAEGKQTTEFLLPKRRDAEHPEIKRCDAKLNAWLSGLPPDAQLPFNINLFQYPRAPAPPHEAPLILNRALLHMVFYMTLSALHRPQASPTESSMTPWEDLCMHGPKTPRDTVRYAAFRITHIAQTLLKQSLVRYLPTTGVTVLQPAIISHMMDIKSPHPDVRTQGLRGFCQSIEVLNRLRDIYAGAEYSVLIIDAAVRRANIDNSSWPILKPTTTSSEEPPSGTTDPNPAATPLQAPTSNASSRKLLSIEDLVDAGLRQKIVAPSSLQVPLTPPPETNSAYGDENLSGGREAANEILNDEAVASRLAMYLATTTPPASAGEDGTHNLSTSAPHLDAINIAPKAEDSAFSAAASLLHSGFTPRFAGTPRLGGGGATPRPTIDFEKEFENLINTDDLADAFTSGDGGLATMQGESSGFFLDMDFLGSGTTPAPEEGAGGL